MLEESTVDQLDKIYPGVHFEAAAHPLPSEQGRVIKDGIEEILGGNLDYHFWYPALPGRPGEINPRRAVYLVRGDLIGRVPLGDKRMSSSELGMDMAGGEFLVSSVDFWC